MTSKESAATTEHAITFTEAVARVKELLELEDGWYDGELGSPIEEDLAEYFLQALAGLAALDRPLPYIYPTIEGSLRAEWQINDIDLTWEYGPTDQHFVHEYEVKSRASREHQIPEPGNPVSAAKCLGAILEGIATGEHTIATWEQTTFLLRD